MALLASDCAVFHAIPQHWGTGLLVATSALGCVYLFGAKLVAMALHSIIREFKSTKTPSDTFLALSTRQDLEEHYAQVNDVILHGLVGALKHEDLKIGLKNLIVEGLQNQEVPNRR